MEGSNIRDNRSHRDGVDRLKGRDKELANKAGNTARKVEFDEVKEMIRKELNRIRL